MDRKVLVAAASFLIIVSFFFWYQKRKRNERLNKYLNSNPTSSLVPGPLDQGDDPPNVSKRSVVRLPNSLKNNSVVAEAISTDAVNTDQDLQARFYASERQMQEEVLKLLGPNAVNSLLEVNNSPTAETQKKTLQNLQKRLKHPNFVNATAAIERGLQRRKVLAIEAKKASNREEIKSILKKVAAGAEAPVTNGPKKYIKGTKP